MNDKHAWTPLQLQEQVAFESILPKIASLIAQLGWPDLDSYNQLSSTKNLVHSNGIPIRCVHQANTASNFEQQYEPRIYLKGELQTRLQSWHDFFNFSVWLSFPKTKSEINSLQYHAMKLRDVSGSKRTDIENLLTLFDENGAIVLCSDPELLELLRDFKWHELFWMRREEMIKSMRFLIFGHSTYEKLLDPYLGLTASSILLDVNESTIALSKTELVKQSDDWITELLQQGLLNHPQQLQPLPILGIPGWDDRNTSEAFYHNQEYFRSRRRRAKVLSVSTKSEKLIAK